MFYNLFFCAQLIFVFYPQRDFYIFYAHIIAFFLFVLWKDWYFSGDFFCNISLLFWYCSADASLDIFIYVKKKKKLMKKKKKFDLSEDLKMLIYVIFKILVFFQLTQIFYELPEITWIYLNYLKGNILNIF